MPTKNPQEPFHRVTIEEAKEMLQNGVHLFDVRDPHEFQDGHLPNADNIPLNSVFARREELPKDGQLLFVCAHGQRSALACEMAAAAGFQADVLYNLEGGTDAWVEAGEPVEK